MKKFLSRLKEVKGEESVTSFARRIGMTQQTVDNYISGRQKPSMAFLYNICCNASVSADWLLGFTDSRTGTCAPAPDPEVAAKLAAAEAEIARLNGVIDGMKMSFEALRR